MKTKKQELGELIYGVHPLIELLKAKRRKLISVYTTRPEPKAWALVKAVWPKYPVAIQYVERDVLTRMAGTSEHQGIVAWAQPYHFRRAFFSAQKNPFLVMLDGVQDTRNVGAILRSAYCTNADGVIMITRDAAPLNGSSIKASAGLAEHLEIYLSPSPQAAIADLKKAGYVIYLAMFKGENAAQMAYQEPLCLVIGSEFTGISKDIMKDGIPVTLPQKTADISYNASVAAGVLLFLIATQLKRI